MHIQFEKDSFSDYDSATKHEWLEQNETGAYAASTLIGVNLRREHGLLAVSSSTLSEKILMLSKFEESLFIENHLYELSTNRYHDSIFPRGFQYIQSACIDPFLRIRFLVEDRELDKTIFLLKDRNVLLVRYELRNMGRPVKMIIKPFLAVRGHHEVNTETQGLNTDSYLGQGWVRWAPKANMPELYVYFKRGEFVPATLWYHNFYYPWDKGRYPNQNEDLYNPGFFQVELQPYDTIDLFISAEELELDELDFEGMYRREMKNRLAAADHVHEISDRLLRILPKNFAEEKSWSLSYFDPLESMRDFLLAMPAMLAMPNGLEEFRNAYSRIGSLTDSGLLPKYFPDMRKQVSYAAADLSLWYIVLGYYYFQYTNDLDFFDDELFDLFRDIIERYSKGISYNIYTEKDGLLFSGNKNISVSWIPLQDSQGQVLRYGKLLEVNALWYNALRVVQFFAEKMGKKRLINRYQRSAEKIKKSFNSQFINSPENSFYDFIVHDEKNREFRINQIIPLTLPFSVVEDRSFAQKVFNRIQEELVTPYGLRSQSPNEATYREEENGYTTRRTVQYYNGAIWPWTIWLYAQASINMKPEQKPLASDFWRYFKPLLQLSESGLLGYIPEVVFLNHHIRQEGIQDSTLSLAAVTWSDFLLQE